MADKKTTTRIPNYSPAEKEGLMEIALRYSNILEDKKTNRTGLEEKATAWKKIETEFNNSAPILAFRTQEQLKRLYENKKKDLRKKMAEQKKNTYLTGGGPAPNDITLDKGEKMLLQIINEKTVKGFQAEFDSDNMDENIEPNINFSTSYTLDENGTEDHFPEQVIFEFVPQEQKASENLTDDNNISVPGGTSNFKSDRCPPKILQKPLNPKLVPPNQEKLTVEPLIHHQIHHRESKEKHLIEGDP